MKKENKNEKERKWAGMKNCKEWRTIYSHNTSMLWSSFFRFLYTDVALVVKHVCNTARDVNIVYKCFN